MCISGTSVTVFAMAKVSPPDVFDFSTHAAWTQQVGPNLDRASIKRGYDSNFCVRLIACGNNQRLIMMQKTEELKDANQSILYSNSKPTDFEMKMWEDHYVMTGSAGNTACSACILCHDGKSLQAPLGLSAVVLKCLVLVIPADWLKGVSVRGRLRAGSSGPRDCRFTPPGRTCRCTRAPTQQHSQTERDVYNYKVVVRIYALCFPVILIAEGSPQTLHALHRFSQSTCHEICKVRTVNKLFLVKLLHW